MENRTKNKPALDAKALATLGMLAALAYAVMAVCKLIPSVMGFLDFDLKGTVIAIAGYLYGPVAALCLTVVVSLLEFLTISGTGVYGLVMNIFATALFVLPAVCLYRRGRTTARAVAGLVLGVVCLCAGMLCWNYIITPLYLQMERGAVVALLPTIAAFNLVKGTLNASAVMVLYPPVAAALRRAGLVPPSAAKPGQRPGFNYIPLIVSLFVLATAIGLAWALIGQ